MTTLTTVLARADVLPADPILAELDVPVLTGVQRQGDVLIVPRAKLGRAEQAHMTAVPAEGVAVVRGEATGNTHLLQPEPGCIIRWSPATASTDSVALGILDVPEGGTAWLIHTDEHGANGIGPGTYALHGKREQAEEIRRVAD